MTLYLIYLRGTLSSPPKKKSMTIERNSSLISLQPKKPVCSLEGNQRINSQLVDLIEIVENTPVPKGRQELFPLLEKPGRKRCLSPAQAVLHSPQQLQQWH